MKNDMLLLTGITCFSSDGFWYIVFSYTDNKMSDLRSIKQFKGQ